MAYGRRCSGRLLCCEIQLFTADRLPSPARTMLVRHVDPGPRPNGARFVEGHLNLTLARVLLNRSLHFVRSCAPDLSAGGAELEAAMPRRAKKGRGSRGGAEFKELSSRGTRRGRGEVAEAITSVTSAVPRAGPRVVKIFRIIYIYTYASVISHLCQR
jgi:hypothetical protein